MFSTHSRVPLSDNFHFLGRRICEEVVKTCDNLAIVEAQLAKLGKWAFHDIRRAIWERFCVHCVQQIISKKRVCLSTQFISHEKYFNEKNRLLISFEH